MKNDIKIEIDVDTYVQMLNARRNQIARNFGWTIPDIVWEYFIEMIEQGITPSDTNPMSVVDNIAVNGDYGDFDKYKNEGETDEEFIKRAEDNCFAIFEDERYIIYSL